MSNKFNCVRCPICDEYITDKDAVELSGDNSILSRHLVREHENFVMYLLRLYDKSEDFGYLVSCIKYEKQKLDESRRW